MQSITIVQGWAISLSLQGPRWLMSGIPNTHHLMDSGCVHVYFTGVCKNRCCIVSKISLFLKYMTILLIGSQRLKQTLFWFITYSNEDRHIVRLLMGVKTECRAKSEMKTHVWRSVCLQIWLIWVTHISSWLKAT